MFFLGSISIMNFANFAATPIHLLEENNFTALTFLVSFYATKLYLHSSSEYISVVYPLYQVWNDIRLYLQESIKETKQSTI